MKKSFYFASAVVLALTIGLSSCGKSKDAQGSDESTTILEMSDEYSSDVDGLIEEASSMMESYTTGDGSSENTSSYSTSIDDYKDAAREGADRSREAIEDAADRLKEAGVNSKMVDKAVKEAHKAVEQAESMLDDWDDED